MGSQKQHQLPVGITIKKYPSGRETIYISFTYRGVTCREKFPAIKADPSNIKRAENLRAIILNQIALGDFKYEEFFPNSKKLSIFVKQPKSTLMAYYLNNYIDHAKLRQLKPGSITAYKGRVKKLIEEIGHLKPDEITVDLLRDYTIKLQVEHNKSPSTIRDRLKILKDVLYEALNDGLIQDNPMHRFKLYKYLVPKHAEDGEKIDPFTLDEIRSLDEACRNEYERLLIRFWLKTGMRTGELCALKWEHILFNKNLIRISENYVSSVGKTGTPKTKSGIRDILINDEELKETIEALKGLTEKQPLVFINPNTQGRWDSYSIRRMFVRLCKEANVRYRYAYQLRHTYATIQISQGRNLWDLCKVLGHKDPSMLYNTYGNFLREYELLTGDLFCRPDGA
ncbi:tyrosine-type recombinase/integrase [Algicola sagamiensis]|uniref:tyrosine-type recombinase/integrase n=1 Tax=Algicola sagamiensis TaxID=163869 RepID=UPI00037DFE48|nr:tyrosine-type recombinase/integrase [Algicola sagamiensis]